jgi:H/ACA ribonucleoprotein complex subunit 3
MKKILRCPKCLIYTMEETCSKCKVKTINPKPAKYSPEDKYGKYRRIAKSS